MSFVSRLQMALRRRIGVLLGAVLSLSLALGGASVVLAIVDSLVLSPLPFPDQQQLTQIVRYQGRERIGPPVAGPVVKEFLAAQKSFAHAAAATISSASVLVDGTAQNWSLAKVTAGYFDMLGMKPALGRWITSADVSAAAAPVVVISHQLWLSQFAGNSDVLGKQLMISGRAFAVIGVAPPKMRFMTFELAGADAALPLLLPADGGSRGNNNFILWGRLRPDASIETAQAEMTLFAQRLASDFPKNHAELSLTVEQVGARFTRGTARIVGLLGLAIGLLLLVGSASLVNLLLADVFARRRELAIRMALGAPRGELIARIAAEACAVTAIAALLGMALALGSLRILRDQATSWVAQAHEISLGIMPIAATLLIAMLIGCLATLVAARHVRELDLQLALRGGARSGMDAARQRTRRALLVAQIGLSLLLMIGAGLLTESLRKVLSESMGFDPNGLLLAQVVLPSAWIKEVSEAVPDTQREALAQSYMQRVEAAVKAIPGVVDAGFALRPPVLVGLGMNGAVSVVGEPPPESGNAPLAELQIVTPGYLKTIAMRLEAGAGFSGRLDADRGKVLLNRTLVERLFGTRDPIGRELNFLFDTPVQIIGVVSDVRQQGLESEARAEVYFSHHGNTFSPDTTLVLRAELDPASLVESVRSTLTAIAPEVAIAGIDTMNAALERSTAQRRFLMSTMVFFGLTAVAIAVVGLFALVSHSVAQRRGELGIRMALGASPGDVRMLVLKEGLLLLAAGLAFGLLLALPSLRLLASWLYGVCAFDLPVLAAQVASLTGLALLVLLVPALRAGRVSPAVALRDE